MREVSVKDRSMNITADLPEPVLETIIRHFQAGLSADVFGVWSIPARPDHYIVFAEQPTEAQATYGPQVFVAIHQFGDVKVLHATKRMMDADYLDPAFFGSEGRLLMLADFGSEDSWGLIALDLAPGVVRDFGVIDVVHPGSIDFTESAAPVAEVSVENGQYVIKFRGEVIASSSDAPTKWFAKHGQRAVFAQVDNRFEYIRTE